MSIDIQKITDRASFLAFRTEWRRLYADASNHVREVKREMRGLVEGRRNGTVEANHAETTLSYRQYDRHMARVSARELMELLDEAKERRDELVARKRADQAEAA